MGLLTDEKIWRGKVFAGGWHQTGQTAVSIEPATGDVLGEVGVVTARELSEYAADAAVAAGDWARTPPHQRAAVLRRAAELFAEHTEEIGTWLARESGKTRLMVGIELAGALDELHHATALPGLPLGMLLPTVHPGRVSLARRRPHGVVAVISPWNFPVILAMRSVAPALAAGNAVVLKPSSETPICGGILIARLLEEAGLPAGILHVLPGSGSALGNAIVEDPNIDMISFTGSTRVGRQLSEAAGRRFKKVACELGGNNAFIVLDDADVDAAAAAGAFGGFAHQGQICMAIGRHLVAESIAERYVAALSRNAEALTVGDPRGDVNLGPIINQSQAEHVDDIVRRTVAAGARITAGGTRNGLFMRPTVLAGVTADAPAFTEETFGPVAAITTFRDDDEAVRLANDTPYGLVAAVRSGSVARARAVADRLRVGMVHINDQTVDDEAVAPFGGAGDSGGASRFGAHTNLDEFTVWQWVTIRDDQSRPQL